MTPHAGNTGICTSRETRRPHTLLSLDPGIRVAGAALFRGSTLIAAELIRSPEKTGNGVRACVVIAQEIMSWAAHTLHMRTVGPMAARTVDELIAEWPKIYATRLRAGKTKEDPNDMPPLAGVGAALGALVYPATLNSVAPSDWKGQVPPDAFLDRIVGRLSSEERTHLPAEGAKAHNVIDAIGIGLHHLGRLDRHRVIAR